MSDVVVKYHVSQWANRDGLYSIQEIRVKRETESSIWIEGKSGLVRKSSLRGSIVDTREQALACVKAQRLRVAARHERQAENYEMLAADSREAAKKQRALIAANPEPTWDECFLSKTCF